jgi:hypothetical protein
MKYKIAWFLFLILSPIFIFSQGKLELIDSASIQGNIRKVLPLDKEYLIGITTDGRLCKWKIDGNNLTILTSEFINSYSDNLFFLSPFKIGVFLPEANNINIYDKNLQLLSSLSLNGIINSSVKKVFSGNYESFIIWDNNDELTNISYQGNKIWTYDIKTFGIHNIMDLHIEIIDKNIAVLLPKKLLIIFNPDMVPIQILETNYNAIKFFANYLLAIENQQIIKLLRLKDFIPIFISSTKMPIIDVESNKDIVMTLTLEKIYLWEYKNQ